MIAFLRVWWPALLVLVIGAAIFGYGQWQRWDAKADVKKDVKIERLESSNAAREKDAAIRKIQNEIIVRDVSPADFDRVLQDHRF